MNSADCSARPQYDKLVETALWKRLADDRDFDVRDLATKVEKATRAALPILDRVVEYMPLYTLHNERHILNIVSWMERLLGSEGIQRLSPLECALCILSAYVHDLGMTLTREEHDEIMGESGASPARQAYTRFRDQFLEDRFLIEHLHRREEHYRANLIESHLLTEYLRTTHADERSDRLSRRLGQISRDSGDAALFEYRRFGYREALELIATSHNQPVHWLREQSLRRFAGSWTTVGNGEQVNYGFVGLLLRLADIMDFDASRTPTILFHHIGLDRELATRFRMEGTSQREWQKHLAITGLHWPVGGGLTYRAQQCPHPAVEKSIRDFTALIRKEVSDARGELRRLNTEADAERCSLLLPEDVIADVRPDRRSGTAVYVYHDWKFELDQGEIVRLLMGESLYGDPSVCIRELLQNALDALELRDLRLQLIKAGGQPTQPVDGVSLSPGHFTSTGMEEELAVQLTWGEEHGQQFIRVEDNGVGITEEVIQRYFTRVGKSFYSSPEFRHEQVDLRTKGLLCTPISRFGVGVLSTFMIADRVSVRTHPGGTENEERRPIDLEAFGPGSLFWTKPGTLQKQGTAVTLWLRHSLHGKQLRLEHQWETCRNELRTHFAFPGRSKTSEALDPGLVAGQHMLWPKYPIRVRPPDGRDWTIDHRFYLDHVLALNVGTVRKQADSWGITEDSVGEPRWDVFDWIDQSGADATGTRIRLWFPRNFVSPKSNQLPLDPPTGSRLMPFWQLSALAELQLGRGLGRSLTLVQGIYVPNFQVRLDQRRVNRGPGLSIWVDFRGAAAPQLTVNRGAVQDVELAWDGLVQGIWDRWLHDVRSEAEATGSGLRNLLLLLPSERERLAGYGPPPEGSGRLVPSELELSRTTIALLVCRYLIDAGTDATLVDQLGAKLACANRSLSTDFSLDLPIGTFFDRAVDFERAIAKAYSIATSVTGRPLLDDGFSQPVDPHLLIQVQGEILQEAFSSDLARSWPVLDLFTAEGRVGDCVLTSPTQFRMELDGRRIRFGDPLGREPEELASLGYDLCFPMTSIPLGRLRADFPNWREDPSCRRKGVHPFLCPHAIREWARQAASLKQQFRGVNRLYAFSPAFDLWAIPFAQWTKYDWKHRDNRSYLWNIGTGEILVASGAMSIKTMKKRGQPYRDFIAAINA